MALTEYINEGLIKVQIEATNKVDAITEMVDLMYNTGEITDRAEFLKSVIERETMGSTGIGYGVAIPHGRADVSQRLILSFGKSPEGIEFDSIDGKKVKLMFMLAAPKKDIGLYLKALAELSRLLEKEAFRNSLMNCYTPKDVIDTIDRFET